MAGKVCPRSRRVFSRQPSPVDFRRSRSQPARTPPTTLTLLANFNSAFGAWYLGTDGHPGSDAYDFESVVLNDPGHGLGFAGSMSMVSPATTVSYSNPPMKWDTNSIFFISSSG